jgi:hypothetical protein
MTTYMTAKDRVLYIYIFLYIYLPIIINKLGSKREEFRNLHRKPAPCSVEPYLSIGFLVLSVRGIIGGTLITVSLDRHAGLWYGNLSEIDHLED